MLQSTLTSKNQTTIVASVAASLSMKTPVKPARTVGEMKTAVKIMTQKHMGGAIFPEIMRWLWRDQPVSADPNDATERSFRSAR